ncbi:MAG: hypothetical protein P8N76_08020 [Pirellulaceae bacterium]|nr:hypothetical protein [Pirellulaceae bacterium]
MEFVLQPWHVAFVFVSAWVNQRQQQIIEFQNVQIEALLKKFGKQRVLLTDGQRRLLAVKGKALGRQALTDTDHDRNARYDSLLASTTRSAEMGLL